MKACFSGFGLAALLLLASGVAYGQQHKVNVDDTGTVIPAHQHTHAKAGHTITWVRSTGGKKPWYVKFTGPSPCSNGSEFGSDGVKVCKVNAVCSAAGDPKCTFAYKSATGRTAQMNDPDVIVDP